MMRKLAIFLVFICYIGPMACTTPGTESGDDVISLDDVGDDVAEAADSGSDSGSDSGGEDEAAADDSAAQEDQVAEEDELEEELDESEEPEQQAQEEQKPTQEDQPQEEQAAQEPAPEPEPEATPEPAPLVADIPQDAQPKLAEITNIKYLANQSGGTVVIETSEQVAYQIRNKPETNQYVIEISGAVLPAKLKRPYLLKEFDAAFAAINAYQNPGSTTARIVIQGKEGVKSEPVVQQEGNSIVVIPGTLTTAVADAEKQKEKDQEKEKAAEQIDVKAAEADDKALGARNLDEFLTGSNRFYGRKISIEVNDQDIREVLNFIATEVGVNLILSEDVQGKVTMKLREIPWDQALITIMKAKKLGYVRQGTVVRISTLAALQEENDSAKKIMESQRTLAPLRVKVIPVSYASVEDLAKQVPPFLTATRGHVVTDSRTSALIVTDTEDVLERVGRLVKELDIPPAQVMIEGKIVEALDSFSQSLGLNWGFNGNQTVLSPGGGANGTDLTSFQSLRLNNLPASLATASPLSLGLRIGRFDIFGDINATLSLAEQDQTIKILSSPRVVTMNKEKANITQKGQVITVQRLKDPQGNETTNPVRTDFSLELVVVPQITAEGSVILDVDVKREFPGALDETGSARPINTRSAKTKVLVGDGQTAVIGGIFSSDASTTETGVPWLRHIPVLGWLFKSRTRADLRNELLIFLTPKLLNVKDQAVEG
jgi:type IV pilus assembly protein PilQ